MMLTISQEFIAKKEEILFNISFYFIGNQSLTSLSINEFIDKKGKKINQYNYQYQLRIKFSDLPKNVTV